MRHVFSTALACLIALVTVSGADARNARRQTMQLPKHSLSTAYAVQTVSVRTGCFSPQLEDILAHIAARTGHRPLVTSGYRPHAHRAGSQHRKCQAADIRIPGVSERAILAAARTAPGIGGIGRYCNGIIHVDTGPKRQWVDC